MSQRGPLPFSTGPPRRTQSRDRAVRHDVHSPVGLLTENVCLTMPPIPLEWQGRELADRFLTATAALHLDASWSRRGPTASRPLGVHARDSWAPILRATGLLVLTLAGDRICAMTRFETSTLAHFGLPRTLPD